MSLPRFTEQEKEIINSKLLIEGEKLFSLHGLGQCPKQADRANRTK